jgi:hypothetical protein
MDQFVVLKRVPSPSARGKIDDGVIVLTPGEFNGRYVRCSKKIRQTSIFFTATIRHAVKADAEGSFCNLVGGMEAMTPISEDQARNLLED